jgi:hypothetical protein
MPEKETKVESVKALKTQSGNTRFVLRDEDGSEYTTFKEDIAKQAIAAEGRRARIRFHEQERNGFTNVYLDGAEPLEEPNGEDGEHADVDEVAWKTTMDAAPYLLSGGAIERPVPPDELFETLAPFKELVADDLRKDDASDDETS